MLFARLALESDRDACIELARMQVEETLTQHAGAFDYDVANATFDRYLAEAHPTFIVAEQNRVVVGMLHAMICEYGFRRGFYTSQEVIYVQPDKRGTRAAAELFRFFINWSDKIGAVEIAAGIANGHHVERTTRFMKRFGFEPAGTHFWKR